MLARPRRTLRKAAVRDGRACRICRFHRCRRARPSRGWSGLPRPARSVAVSVKGSGFRPRRQGRVDFGQTPGRLLQGHESTAALSSGSWYRPATAAGRASACGSSRRAGPPESASFRVAARGSHSARAAPRSTDLTTAPAQPRRSAVQGRCPAVSRGSSAPAGGGGAPGSRWVPPRALTWYWQLHGTINNSQPVAAYDIDGFDNSAGEVATLHGQGKHVICYIDVGTAENWRADDRPSQRRCWAPPTAGRASGGWTSASSASSSRS